MPVGWALYTSSYQNHRKPPAVGRRLVAQGLSRGSPFEHILELYPALTGILGSPSHVHVSRSANGLREGLVFRFFEILEACGMGIDIGFEYINYLFLMLKLELHGLL